VGVIEGLLRTTKSWRRSNHDLIVLPGVCPQYGDVGERMEEETSWGPIVPNLPLQYL
jgi:hypothetical protein